MKSSFALLHIYIRGMKSSFSRQSGINDPISMNCKSKFIIKFYITFKSFYDLLKNLLYNILQRDEHNYYQFF
jgi:hypothetical protein